MPFEKYDWLKLGDLERCPFVIFSPESAKWGEEDNRRMLLIALERYANFLQRDKNFKRGDRVRMKDGDSWIHGEVTIVREDECKVMWDEEWAPNYWYYPKSLMEKINANNNPTE